MCLFTANGQVDGCFCGFGATRFVHFQHDCSSAQLLNFTGQVGLGARLFFVATHGVTDFGQVTRACAGDYRGLVGAVANVDDGQQTLFQLQTQFAQSNFECLVQSSDAIVVEARSHGAKYGHFFCGHSPSFLVSLNLFGHIAQRIAGAFAVKLVDGHKLGKVEHVDFFQLAGRAKLWRHDVHRHIDMRHDGSIALANAGGFNHHHIKASHLASGHHIGQRCRNFAAKIARGQTAHEHALAIAPGVDGIHANAVA